MLLGYVLLFAVLNLLLMALSVPMIRRKVKPNMWYGFRTPKTMSRPDIWYPANEYSGALLFVAGAINLVGAIALSLLPGISMNAYVTSFTILMTITLTWAVVWSFRYLKKL